MTKIRPEDLLFHQTKELIKEKSTNIFCFKPEVLIGCKERFQLQQQWPKEIISKQSLPQLSCVNYVFH